MPPSPSRLRALVAAVVSSDRRHLFLPLRQVYVYNFADLALLHQIDTLANKAGLCAVSCEPRPMVLACPGIHRGQVRRGGPARRARRVLRPCGSLRA